MAADVVSVEPEQLPRSQQDRRHRIVRAALELLDGAEYDAIQMRDIAARAGVALATIYRYFASKEHLYAAALGEWAAGYPTAGARGGEATSDEARLRALMRRAVRAFERHPHVMRVVTVLEGTSDVNARALFEQFGRRNAATLMGALSSYDTATAAAIIETANSVMFTRLRSWALGRCSIRDVDRSVQRALDLIFEPLEAPRS
ncbi:MAG TPA: TetR family transcriptional regulator [Acidimicrobiia bacterium]|nr:TetR family transcriptional regulator [Acidimicrobiia bacterium]